MPVPKLLSSVADCGSQPAWAIIYIVRSRLKTPNNRWKVQYEAPGLAIFSSNILEVCMPTIS